MLQRWVKGFAKFWYHEAQLSSFRCFFKIVKVTNHTGLWDAQLAWYSLSATYQICQGHEGDRPHWILRCQVRLILSKCYSSDLMKSWGYKPHWTVRYQAHLIISECYLLDLLKSWRWQTTLDSEIPSSPDNLWVLLAGFAEVMKVTNHTGQWDTKLTW